MDRLGNRLLVIFDGHCGFCNRSVRWLLRHDRRDRLRFAPSESQKIADFLSRHDFSASNTESNSILVVSDLGGPTERVLARSEAIISLLRELPLPWPAAAVALRWIPRPVRDLGYRLIARGRHRIGGRWESCPVPTPAEQTRFLEYPSVPRKS
jgi:predicted DCC family thiol-disulfide oxidoreductase YuxK